MVLVDPRTAVIRVGPDCNCKVYLMMDGKWKLSDSEMLIPEGFYVVSPEFVNEETK